MADQPLFFAPLRQPVTDPKTGLMSRPWYLFLQALWLRTGGAVDPVDDALLIGPPESAGEDLQLAMNAFSNALAQAPPVAELQQQVQDLTTAVGELRELVAVLTNRINDITQGTTL